MSAANIVDVILFTRQVELTKIATDILKMKGVSNIMTATQADDCIDKLTRYAKAMLLLDWEMGAVEVVRVLGFNRQHGGGQTRPMLLVAGKISEQIVATAAEYGVAQILTEEANKRNLGSRLAAMLLGDTLADDIKKALVKVAKARSEGDLKRGSQVLLPLLPKYPNNLRLKCEVAELMMEMGEHESALKTLEGMDKPKPPYLRGVHLMGRCLAKLGRFPEALQTLEQASLFNPHDVDRLVDIGQALLQMDRVKDAAGEFDKALAIDPEHHGAVVGSAECRLMDNQVNEALEMLKDISSDLEMASIFNTCAVMNMRQKRHTAGMHLYESALRVLGKDPRLQARLYFNMGMGYRRWGKKDRAKLCLEASLKLDPTFSKAVGQLEALKQSSATKIAPAGGVSPLVEPAADASLLDNFFEGAEPAALEDFSTSLDHLLGEHLEESIYPKGKKPA